jgi:cytochrome c biogenesis protein CcmG/thiol:disulfide interchange protein DsbE
LIGSLAVSAVLSVVVGLVIARSGGTGTADTDSVVIDVDPTFAVPSIGVNDKVEGTPLPAATVRTLAGDAFETSSLVGQPLVVNIWGSTCGPCKAELPDLAAAHLRFGDRVRFVGIDYLPPSDAEEQFARDKGIQYELFYDADGEFITAAGIATFPVTLFVAPDGTIVEQTGLLDEERIAALVTEHFG